MFDGKWGKVKKRIRAKAIWKARERSGVMAEFMGVG